MSDNDEQDPGQCRICHQMVGIEDGLEDDGDCACHPCRIEELEQLLAASECRAEALQAILDMTTSMDKAKAVEHKKRVDSASRLSRRALLARLEAAESRLTDREEDE